MYKHVNGTDSIYVSDTGTVFYDGEYGKFEYTPSINNCGYNRVAINVYGKQKRKLVHRLVAEAFIPKRRKRKLVNHIDGNKLNNNVSNLEWVTHKQNMRHASLHGLMKNCGGNKRGSCLLPTEIIKNIMDEYTGSYGEIKKLSVKYNTSTFVITGIVGKMRHYDKSSLT